MSDKPSLEAVPASLDELRVWAEHWLPCDARARYTAHLFEEWDAANAECAAARERVRVLEEGIRKLYDGCIGCTQTPNLVLRCWNCRQYKALLAQPPAGGANDE